MPLEQGLKETIGYVRRLLAGQEGRPAQIGAARFSESVGGWAGLVSDGVSWFGATRQRCFGPILRLGSAIRSTSPSALPIPDRLREQRAYASRRMPLSLRRIPAQTSRADVSPFAARPAGSRWAAASIPVRNCAPKREALEITRAGAHRLLHRGWITQGDRRSKMPAIPATAHGSARDDPRRSRSTRPRRRWCRGPGSPRARRRVR